MTRPSQARDSHELIAALSRDRVRIDLGTYDLCCLVALHLHAEREALASFLEDKVVDLFEQVCDTVEPGAENPRKRATHAIQRLRDQHMLTRVDGAGIVSAGEYALTRLAGAVVEYFRADEALTRESLTLLTRTLLGQLAEVRQAAAKADSPGAWNERVVGPLRVTVGDLVRGIERRQRGLDAAQEDIQSRIANLIEDDWFDAVDEAQDLLDTTTDTLRELNEILLGDTQQFLTLLQEILELAEGAGAEPAREATQRVIEQVDRIASWGQARQRAWSDYYQRVHRYLRDVVRLDPDRALSRRLRDQLAGWVDRPFHLVVAREPPLRQLRPVETAVERPPVVRPRTDRERPPAAVAAGDGGIDLERLVADALAAGAGSLSELTAAVLPHLEPAHRFAAAGRVAAIAARLARPRPDRERPWVRATPALEIEEWPLSRDSR